MELTDTHYRYLLTIYELSRTTLDVGAASVARAMQVSKPSVTRMLKVLMDKGLLVKERYGKIYLTDRGVLLAKKLSDRVGRLKERIPKMELELTEEELGKLAGAMAAVLPEDFTL